jgi:hypothetical protein
MQTFKFVIKYMLAACLPLFMQACTTTEETVVPIRVLSNGCVFEASGGNSFIAIETDGMKWDAKLSGESSLWFSIVNEEAGIRVTAPLNNEISEKRAEIIITAGEFSMELPVVQNGGSATTVGLSLIPEVEEMAFNSEGGDFTITVVADVAWSATLSEPTDWLKLTADNHANTLRGNALPNEGTTVRKSSIIITAGDNSITLDVAQYTQAEHPYFGMLGEWDLYCDAWFQGQTPVNAGKYTKCTFEPSEVNSAFVMRNLFIEGSILKIYFNPARNTIEIPVGWLVKALPVYYYIDMIDIRNMFVDRGDLRGDISADRNTIELSGFPEGFGFGVTADNGESVSLVYDSYYTAGNVTRFERAAGSASTLGAGCYMVKSKSIN